MSTPPELPPWPNEGLSSRLANAARNERVSALALPDVFGLLELVDAAFRSALTAARNYRDSQRLVPCMLLTKAHADIFAATRLGLSGQTVEPFMPIRGAIEASWYALHMFADHEPPARTLIWMKRHTDAAAKTKCRNEFSIERVHGTHVQRDKLIASIFRYLYDEAIDFGAHPNQRGVFSTITDYEVDDDGMRFQVLVLTNDLRFIRSVLQRTIETGIGALKTFQLIFVDEFRAAGLDIDIERLVNTTRATFPGRKKHPTRSLTMPPSL